MADITTLTEEFRAAVAGNYAVSLAGRQTFRVLLVVASLIEVYDGRRFALQVWNTDIEAWHTLIIVRDAALAAEWFVAMDRMEAPAN